MKILCLADEENKAYWDYFRKEKLDDIDLILSCGDLKADYLTFLVTMGHAPLLYIHGNHDEGYRTRPPEGCDCIDDKVVTFRGLRIVGLGGCLRYRPGEYQYSEADMQRRIRRMSWKLRKGVDIVVAHAPVQGFGDRKIHAEISSAWAYPCQLRPWNAQGVQLLRHAYHQCRRDLYSGDPGRCPAGADEQKIARRRAGVLHQRCGMPPAARPRRRHIFYGAAQLGPF